MVLAVKWPNLLCQRDGYNLVASSRWAWPLRVSFGETRRQEAQRQFVRSACLAVHAGDV